MGKDKLSLCDELTRKDKGILDYGDDNDNGDG